LRKSKASKTKPNNNMPRVAQASKTPNPASKYFEWAGGNNGGHISYYDKSAVNPETKKAGVNVLVKLPFAFIVIGITSTIKGWHDGSDSAIYSNEVKDTVGEPLVVKAFDGGVLATGFYSAIRDRVAAAGGRFTSNIYLAYRDAGVMKIGCLQLHGASLNSWVEFKNASGDAIWKKAVGITSYKEGKKGSIVYRTPVFTLRDVSTESDDAAGVLQEQLAKYHTEYFARTRTEAAQAPANPAEAPRGGHPAEAPQDDSWGGEPEAPPADDQAF
jgi:hypothetical protein